MPVLEKVEIKTKCNKEMETDSALDDSFPFFFFFRVTSLS